MQGQHHNLEMYLAVAGLLLVPLFLLFVLLLILFDHS